MEQSKDFISREIQKLTLLLIGLLEKVAGIKSQDFDIGIQQTDEILNEEFDLTIKDICEIKKNDFLLKVNHFHETHLEKLVELIYEILKKVDEVGKEDEFDQKKLAEKAILLIEYMKSKSKTFSLHWNSLERGLQKYLV